MNDIREQYKTCFFFLHFLISYIAHNQYFSTFAHEHLYIMIYNDYFGLLHLSLSIQLDFELPTNVRTIYFIFTIYYSK